MTTFFSLFRPFLRLAWLCLLLAPMACVDPEDLMLRGTVDVIVVDGMINNVAEPQVIRLNRSRADSLTGRFGVFPLTQIRVQVIVDSSQVIDCHETEKGTYQLPSDFKGQEGHAYQLRFRLADGKEYVSTQQVMPAVPPITKLSVQFNPNSLPVTLLGGFTKGFDLLIDAQDPVTQRNFYRWDWNLYEKQDWCKSCTQGYYMTNQLGLVSSFPNALIYQAGPELLEDCFDAPSSLLFYPTFFPTPYFVNDYTCRTQCWEIIHSHTLNLFSDQYSNGGLILAKNVGQIPYYTHNPALIDVRQLSLTPDAYRFLTLFQQQTQNTGGLADAPPAALVGNVHNRANPQEKVVGYFTASAVFSQRYWLDKKDASGIPYGGGTDEQGKFIQGNEELFYALNRRRPAVEPMPPNFIILGGSSRPPTAICVSGDTRTPFKPEGWRD